MIFSIQSNTLTPRFPRSYAQITIEAKINNTAHIPTFPPVLLSDGIRVLGHGSCSKGKLW